MCCAIFAPAGRSTVLHCNYLKILINGQDFLSVTEIVTEIEQFFCTKIALSNAGEAKYRPFPGCNERCVSMHFVKSGFVSHL